jgi:hypothetical protein
VSEDKGWQVEIHAKRAPDADGWRVYVMVSLGTGDAVRTVPLSFKDSRTFETERAAAVAGLELARVWIEEQG